MELLTNFEGFAFVNLHFIVWWNTIQVLLKSVSPTPSLTAAVRATGPGKR